ncbi:MAG TPA: biotin--[acetyl-CoA-carboxylase] ligase [Candidatus Limnocylindrales bacterium]|nr:biotin--[acetyl-CoA-carboxylase] ligase [Candidatus Limnocylindrales bacterium]
MSSRQSVLAALRDAGGFISGEALAARLGITRAAIWKHIEVLKGQGYGIEGARARGYRLLSQPDELRSSTIEALMSGGRFGSRITVLDVTRSTNSDAMALAREGAPEGTVVIAEQQTAGRGRLGRTWESVRGLNLYMSVLLRPSIVPAQAPQLALVAGVAVAETVGEEGLRCGIKWPNDVVVAARPERAEPVDSARANAAERLETGGGHPGGHGAGAQATGLRKLAGILTEIEAETERVSAIVAGIGVNLNSQPEHFSAELAGKATSVRMETGVIVDRAAFTARLLTRLQDLYDAYVAGGFAAVSPRWRALSVLEGRMVRVGGAGEVGAGVCVGIDTDGALLLQTDTGSVRRVLAGDVTLQGGYDGWQP